MLRWGSSRRRFLSARTAKFDPSQSFALYADFKNSLYRSGSSTNTVLSSIPGFACVRTGTKSRFNAAGTTLYTATANNPLIVPGEGCWFEEAYTNVLLNAGTATDLITQTTAALTAAQYTLSFYGTGTATLTGSSVAGPLVGTGATNRVSLVFTPTAAALTVTVTGSIKYAMLTLSPDGLAGPIVPTAGAIASTGADNITFTGLSVAAPYVAVAELQGASGQSINADFINWGSLVNGGGLYAPTGPGTQFIRETSVTTVNASATLVTGVRQRLAARFSSNDQALAQNGAAAILTGTGIPPTISSAGLGPSLFGFSGSRPNAPILFAGIKPGALNNAGLVALSAAYS